MKTLLELVAAFEKKEGVALTYFTGYRHFSYTYKELYTLACKAATLLEKNGIREKDCVLLWGYNRPEWIIMFFACVIRGARVVPIDTRHNVAFVEKVLAQTKAPLLVTSTTFPLPQQKIKVEYAENLLFSIQALQPHPLRQAREDTIVEIAYTSGTTGDPKGALLTHKNLCASLLSLELLIKPHNNMTLLSLLPLSHIFELVGGMLLPLYFGARIVYPPSLKPSMILDCIRKESVTALLLVPRLLEALTHRIQKKYGSFFQPALTCAALPVLQRLFFAPVRHLFASLKVIVVGGAPLDAELERIWENMGFPLIHGYGLTETAALLTCLLPDVHRHGSVGKVVPGVTLNITDDGEILAQGDNIFSGYFKNKDKTRDTFFNGWFKTGDVGEIDADGFLFIKGRKKDMVKTRSGVNVYPEDVEAALKKQKGVKDACVIGIPTRQGEEIHAVLLLEKGNPAQIVAAANKLLDATQQIADYSVWPERDFPRTTTMKIKKFQVAASLQKGMQMQPAQVLPPVQAIISQLTSKNISDNARLGDLGLSSLDRVELASRLEQQLLCDIDENDLRTETTVKEVEDIVAREMKEREQYIRRWTRWRVLQWTRVLMQHLFFFPLTALFCRRKCTGEEHLQDLQGPVIFVVNHQSHFDTPVLLMSIPFRFRARIAPAAWQEYFFGEQKEWLMKLWQLVTYNFTTIFWNGFMFPQTKGFRKSLRYAGELVDDDWSLLVFPEGARTTTGKMLPFKEGIGFLAKELRIPIVPIKLDGLMRVLPAKAWWPHRGPVIVKIGKPLTFTTESIVDITRKVEAAVQRL